MQILVVSSAVGIGLPIPLKHCVAATGGSSNVSCSVVVQYQSTPSRRGASETDWSLEFKPAVSPSCTLDLVDAGMCSGCSADHLATGACPPNVYTLVTSVAAPGGVQSNTSLAIVAYVGASVISAEVTACFQIVSSMDGIDQAPQTTARLQQMVIDTQVRPQACQAPLPRFCDSMLEIFCGNKLTSE